MTQAQSGSKTSLVIASITSMVVDTPISTLHLHYLRIDLTGMIMLN
jgi:hypothetical protein